MTDQPTSVSKSRLVAARILMSLCAIVALLSFPVTAALVLTPAGRMSLPWILICTIVCAIFAVAAWFIHKRSEKTDWRKPLVLLIVVLVGLLTAEVSARVYFNYRLERVGERAIDPELGWRTRPNHHFTAEYPEFGKVEYTTDGRGFRVAGDPNSNKTKVFFIGDSYTQALQVSDDATYYSGINDDDRFEVWAYGSGGYGNYQQYKILDQYIDEVKPDIIVWQLCSNDFLNNSYILESQSRFNNNHMNRPYLEDGEEIWRYPFPPDNPLYHIVSGSRLLRYFDTKLHIGMIGRGLSIEDSLKQGDENYIIAGKTTAEVFNLIRERAGSTTIFAISTDPWLRELWEEILTTNDIELLDVDRALQQAKDRGEKIDGLPFDSHWNVRGHEIAGEVIMERLNRWVSENSVAAN